MIKKVSVNLGCRCSEQKFDVEINDKELEGLSQEGKDKYIEDCVNREVLKRVDIY